MKKSIIAGFLLFGYLLPTPSFGAEDSDEQNGVNGLTQEELLHRIRLDFNKKKEDVLPYISRYYPEVTDSMLTAWERNKSLEMMEIDGEKCYFRNAAPNLFRINGEARERKIAKEGPIPLLGYEVINEQHLPEVMAQLLREGKTQSTPYRMRVKYRVTVPEGVVAPGELIRCWLPYPREDNRRQRNVNLISANSENYLISPAEYAHRTIYMEKRQPEKGGAEFCIEFAYSSSAEWFNLNPDSIAPYNREDALYQEFTAERLPHIPFTPRLRAIADSIRGDENNPYLIVRKLFDYVNDEYPWASAREYSTIGSIPQYVVENRHGDCGQVSLLFITLCRICGIPAKWQSGFMMHPGGVNLHDWAEVWYEGKGWIPVDQSFGVPFFAKEEKSHYFFANGIDAYRLIVNEDFSAPLFPPKRYPRSETVDFQRGEVETEKCNLYFNQWDWNLEVSYEPTP